MFLLLMVPFLPSRSFKVLRKSNVEFTCNVSPNSVMDLNASDILMMLRNFEVSRGKLWEMVRRYDPLQVAVLLYLLENVKREPKKVPIILPDEALLEFAGAKPYNVDAVKRLQLKPSLRTDRAVSVTTPLFAWPRYVRRLNDSRTLSKGDENIVKLLDRMRSPPNDTSGEDALLHPYLLIVAHNLSTSIYQSFLNNFIFLLFPDDMQADRSCLLAEQLVAIRYLRYHRQLNLQRSLCATDSRRFRYVILPRPRRVYHKPRTSDGSRCEYIYQSLYQGFHSVIDQEHDTSLTVRVFNRYGELSRASLPPLRLTNSCTFEAVIVPVDVCGWSRSWRYWPYREGYRIYVCDVFRYGDNVLATVPFSERLRYVRRLCDENPYLTMARTSRHVSELTDRQPVQQCSASPAKSTKAKQDVNYLVSLDNSRNDIFCPVVGWIAREASSKFSPFYCDGLEDKGRCAIELEASTPLQYRYHVSVVYDLIEDKMFRVHGTEKDAVISSLKSERLFYDLEMADERRVWLAYGNTDEAYYLCVYNPLLHQYEHMATIERSPYDTVAEPKYQQERLVVVNAKIKPRGFMYLRVYSDRNGNYIGYETKLSTSRYDVPCNAHEHLLRSN